jgi:hypothetical protein
MRRFGMGLAHHSAEIKGDSQLGIKSKPQISQISQIMDLNVEPGHGDRRCFTPPTFQGEPPSTNPHQICVI